MGGQLGHIDLGPPYHASLSSSAPTRDAERYWQHCSVAIFALPLRQWWFEPGTDLEKSGAVQSDGDLFQCYIKSDMFSMSVCFLPPSSLLFLSPLGCACPWLIRVRGSIVIDKHLDPASDHLRRHPCSPKSCDLPSSQNTTRTPPDPSGVHFTTHSSHFRPSIPENTSFPTYRWPAMEWL